MRPNSPKKWAALTGLALLFSVQPVWAGDDGGTPDAAVLDVPDASVGQGGADQGSEEGDDSTGHVVSFCRTNRDCSKGFGCEGNHCKYVGYRDAEGGCLLGLNATSMAALGLVLLGARRLRGRK